MAILVGITVLVTVAALLTLSAIRRSRRQGARVEELASDLKRMREESRRRVAFLNAISHDLRTPLNGIALQTQVMEKAVKVGDGAMLARAQEEIRGSLSVAAAILDALLQYAHADVDQTVIAPVNLQEVVQQTVDPFREAAEEKLLTFAMSIPPGLEIRTDRGKLQRILAHLLDNAVKFTARGSIRVRAGLVAAELGSRQDGGDGAEAHGREGEKNAVRLTVEDTGCGIPQADQERLFEEFFQVNNPARDPQQGLGLGLAIARRLTEQLGGLLRCTSRPREGTVFHLDLPMAFPESRNG